jgi:hypothetical protein
MLLLLPQQSWSGVCILSIIIMGRAATTTEEQGDKGIRVGATQQKQGLLNRSRNYNRS